METQAKENFFSSEERQWPIVKQAVRIFKFSILLYNFMYFFNKNFIILWKNCKFQRIQKIKNIFNKNSATNKADNFTKINENFEKVESLIKVIFQLEFNKY